MPLDDWGESPLPSCVNGGPNQNWMTAYRANTTDMPGLVDKHLDTNRSV